MNTKMTNDFVIETIQALRGGRSKSWLSQRLKYKFNQVYLWESERRAFYWSDFEAICEVMKRPFQENAKLFFSNKEKFQVHLLLKRAVSPYKQKEIAAIFGVTTSKLSRWLSGESDIPFVQACNLNSSSDHRCVHGDN